MTTAQPFKLGEIYRVYVNDSGEFLDTIKLHDIQLMVNEDNSVNYKYLVEPAIGDPYWIKESSKYYLRFEELTSEETQKLYDDHQTKQAARE